MGDGELGGWGAWGMEEIKLLSCSVTPLPRSSSAPLLRCPVAPLPRYPVPPLLLYSVAP
jgi:hypothetical protein